LAFFIAAAGAVKPASISDVAGDYKVVKATGEWTCPPTMQLRTSGNQMTTMKFVDFPYKCNVPWKLNVVKESGSSGRSSTIGTYVESSTTVGAAELAYFSMRFGA